MSGQILDRDFCCPVPQKQVQLLLVAEVVKQQGFADPGLRGDFARRAFLVAVLGENPETGVEDPLLFFRGEGKEFFVHGTPR